MDDISRRRAAQATKNPAALSGAGRNSLHPISSSRQMARPRKKEIQEEIQRVNRSFAPPSFTPRGAAAIVPAHRHRAVVDHAPEWRARPLESRVSRPQAHGRNRGLDTIRS